MLVSPDTPIDLHLHTTYSDGRWSLSIIFLHLTNAAHYYEQTFGSHFFHIVITFVIARYFSHLL